MRGALYMAGSGRKCCSLLTLRCYRQKSERAQGTERFKTKQTQGAWEFYFRSRAQKIQLVTQSAPTVLHVPLFFVYLTDIESCLCCSVTGKLKKKNQPGMWNTQPLQFCWDFSESSIQYHHPEPPTGHDATQACRLVLILCPFVTASVKYRSLLIAFLGCCRGNGCTEWTSWMVKQARPSDPNQSYCNPSQQRPQCRKTESR